MKQLSGAKAVSSRQTSESYIAESSRILSFLDPFDAVILSDNSQESLENLLPPLFTVTNVPFFSLEPFFGICLS